LYHVKGYLLFYYSKSNIHIILIILIMRAFVVIFAIVVLGLSVDARPFEKLVKATTAKVEAKSQPSNETGEFEVEVVYGSCTCGHYGPYGLGLYSGQRPDPGCTKCPIGRYMPDELATSCDICPAGTYCANTGMCSATKCPAGTYSSATGATSSATCSQCPAGKYSSATGATSSATCTACAAGTYSAVTGATSSSTCTPCAIHTFQPDTGSTSCGDAAAYCNYWCLTGVECDSPLGHGPRSPSESPGATSVLCCTETSGVYTQCP